MHVAHGDVHRPLCLKHLYVPDIIQLLVVIHMYMYVCTCTTSYSILCLISCQQDSILLHLSLQVSATYINQNLRQLIIFFSILFICRVQHCFMI